MQLPCPSLEDYEDLEEEDYSGDGYAETEPFVEDAEDPATTDEGDGDPNFAEEVAGAAVDEAKQTTTEEVRAKVKDSVSKGLKKIFGN